MRVRDEGGKWGLEGEDEMWDFTASLGCTEHEG